MKYTCFDYGFVLRHSADSGLFAGTDAFRGGEEAPQTEPLYLSWSSKHISSLTLFGFIITSVSDPDPHGSALNLTPWIRSRIRIKDSDSGSGSGSRSLKITEKWQKLNIFFKISLA